MSKMSQQQKTTSSRASEIQASVPVLKTSTKFLRVYEDTPVVVKYNGDPWLEVKLAKTNTFWNISGFGYSVFYREYRTNGTTTDWIESNKYVKNINGGTPHIISAILTLRDGTTYGVQNDLFDSCESTGLCYIRRDGYFKVRGFWVYDWVFGHVEVEFSEPSSGYITFQQL